MEIDLAIIGGTGVGSRLAKLPGRRVAVPTSEGMLHGSIVQFGGATVLAVQRHSSGHTTPPHKVHFAATALGLRAIGVHRCLSTAAVGCLRTEWPVGTIVACTDFIDASGRNLTLFNSRVLHTAMDVPFGGPHGALRSSMRKLGHHTPEKAVYLQANGPRYETFAEIDAFATLGADLVGMTAASEAALMREAGIAYECLAVVTNLAAGLGDEIDHGAVGDVMGEKSATILEILETAAMLIRGGVD